MTDLYSTKVDIPWMKSRICEMNPFDLDLWIIWCGWWGNRVFRFAWDATVTLFCCFFLLLCCRTGRPNFQVFFTLFCVLSLHFTVITIELAFSWFANVFTTRWRILATQQITEKFSTHINLSHSGSATVHILFQNFSFFFLFHQECGSTFPRVTTYTINNSSNK